MCKLVARCRKFFRILFSVLAFINKIRRMFHTDSNGKCFRSHEELLFMKHIKSISCTVTDCKNNIAARVFCTNTVFLDKKSFDLAVLPASSYFLFMDFPCLIFFYAGNILTQYITNLCPKMNFPTQTFDFFSN